MNACLRIQSWKPPCSAQRITRCSSTATWMETLIMIMVYRVKREDICPSMCGFFYHCSISINLQQIVLFKMGILTSLSFIHEYTVNKPNVWNIKSCILMFLLLISIYYRFSLWSKVKCHWAIQCVLWGCKTLLPGRFKSKLVKSISIFFKTRF